MNMKQETIKTTAKKPGVSIPFVITLIGALLLIASFFLPLASATGKYREYLQKYPEELYAEEINMTNGEAMDISLLEFDRMYAAAAKLGLYKDTAIACMVIISIFGLFALLITLFTALRKPAVIIVLSLLSLGVFQLIMWDFEDRGVLPSNNFGYGIAGAVCYAGIVTVFIGAILLLVKRIVLKRQSKSSLNE